MCWVYNEKLASHNILIYNKGDYIEIPCRDNLKICDAPNVGCNQYDILDYICTNYHSIPELLVFLQGNPFDHCSLESIISRIDLAQFSFLFDKPITAPFYFAWNNGKGLYTELNTSGYIRKLEVDGYDRCIFTSFNSFMSVFFSNYIPVFSTTFCPGSQYVVPRHMILDKPLYLWLALRELLSHTVKPIEGHVLERALYMIFISRYRPREISAINKKLLRLREHS